MIDLLPPEARQPLLQACRRRLFDRREVIFHEGDLADALFMIRTGRAAVLVTTPTGERVTLTVLGPGATFGEIALIADPPIRSATVTALEPCEALCLRRADLRALRTAHPEVEQYLLELLAAQVRRLTAQLLEALYLPADKRVFRRLADLAHTYGSRSAPAVEIPITQEALASMAGTSRITTNQALQRAAQVGCITLGRGHVRILDPVALSRLGS
jgi:CRP-like cAMP-binding protein